MKRLRLFLHEYLKSNPELVSEFAKLKNMTTTQEMYVFASEKVQQTTDALREKNNTEGVSQGEDLHKILVASQLFKKIFMDAMRSGGDPVVFSKFDSVFSLPEEQRRKRINEVVEYYGRQL